MSAYSNDYSFSFNGRPTILQVIPSLESGGVEIETVQIGEAIAKGGGRSIIAAREGALTKGLAAKGIEFINFPLDTKNPLTIKKHVQLLKNLIQAEKVDLVHVRSRAPGWSAYNAAKASGIPYVTTYHAAYSSKSVFKTLYNSVMARGDRVIAISQFIADHITSKYKKFRWFDPEKVRLVHRGIDLEYFNPEKVSDANIKRLRKAWGLKAQDKVLLMPGRITKGKGQDVLIKALSLLKQTNVYVFFVGSAKNHEAYLEKLMQYAGSLDLKGRVRWIPPLDKDLPAAYKLADIIVCASTVPEGFGRLMAEAQAMEKPVVSTNHGAAPEVLLEGPISYLTPPGDAKALAHAIQQILALDPKTRQEIGRKARLFTQANFSNDAMCTKTLQIYQELLEGKR